MALHRGLLVVDSTLPVSVLDAPLRPGWSVRDELGEAMRLAVVEAIAALPARVTADGGLSDAQLVGAW